MKIKEYLKKYEYEIRLVINLLFLSALLSVTTFFIIQNLSTIKLPMEYFKGKRVYLLESYSTIDIYKKFGLDENSFIDRVSTLEKELIKRGFTVFTIDEKKLKDIPKDSALFLADTIGLENYTISQIEKFVKNGGKLLFNFKSGFNSIGKRTYKQDYLISKITGFSYLEDFAYTDPKENKYATLKWLSPLNNQNKTTKFHLAIYEKLPVFKYPYWAKPDMIATLNGENRELNLNSSSDKNTIINSGLLWHGSYGKGKWVYFNFPTYTILDSAGSYNDFMKLLSGMLDFLFLDTIIRIKPYFDKKSAIVISGNFNYQYKSIIPVSRVFSNYNTKFTAFLSAKEVQNSPLISKAVFNNPLIEVASMGYIGEKITGKSYEQIKKEIGKSKAILNSQKKELEVSGFFPPKKAINESMIEVLGFNKYSYILDYNLKNYYPEYRYSRDILSIPVTATDANYLTGVDTSFDDIMENILKEMKFIEYVNGVYSFNFNAHLMGYKNNITMLEKFLKKTVSKKDIIMTNKELQERVKKVNKITIKSDTAMRNIIVTIENRNEEELENFSFRVYIKPNHKVVNVQSEYGIHTETFKKVADMEYDIIIKKLRRNSSGTYLIRYEEIEE